MTLNLMITKPIGSNLIRPDGIVAVPEATPRPTPIRAAHKDTLPEPIWDGDSTLAHPPSIIPIIDDIDDENVTSFRCRQTLIPLCLGPHLSVDEPILRNDIRHGIRGIQRLLTPIKGRIGSKVPTIHVPLVPSVVRWIGAILHGERTLRIEPRPFTNVDSIDLVTIQLIGHGTRSFGCIVIANEKISLVDDLIAVAVIDYRTHEINAQQLPRTAASQE